MSITRWRFDAAGNFVTTYTSKEIIVVEKKKIAFKILEILKLFEKKKKKIFQLLPNIGHFF